jgi:hypothetical protein
MDKGLRGTVTGANMKGPGRMIYSMGLADGLMQMVHTSTQCSVSEESTARHNMCSQMEMLTIAYTIMTWKIG